MTMCYRIASCSENALSAEQVRSLCQPLPDQYQSFGMNDNRFAKVPQTNATMRVSLTSGNALQCLTMFKNRYLPIIYDRQKSIIDYDQHLSLLGVINDPAFNCWSEGVGVAQTIGDPCMIL